MCKNDQKMIRIQVVIYRNTVTVSSEGMPIIAQLRLAATGNFQLYGVVENKIYAPIHRIMGYIFSKYLRKPIPFFVHYCASKTAFTPSKILPSTYSSMAPPPVLT